VLGDDWLRAIALQSRANTLATETPETFGHQSVRWYATLRKQSTLLLWLPRTTLLAWFRLLTSSADGTNLPLQPPLWAWRRMM